MQIPMKHMILTLKTENKVSEMQVVHYHTIYNMLISNAILDYNLCKISIINAKLI